MSIANIVSSYLKSILNFLVSGSRVFFEVTYPFQLKFNAILRNPGLAKKHPDISGQVVFCGVGTVAGTGCQPLAYALAFMVLCPPPYS
jgi:hypothetical protein